MPKIQQGGDHSRDAQGRPTAGASLVQQSRSAIGSARSPSLGMLGVAPWPP
jgi:hypothetical protein